MNLIDTLIAAANDEENRRRRIGRTTQLVKIWTSDDLFIVHNEDMKHLVWHKHEIPKEKIATLNDLASREIIRGARFKSAIYDNAAEYVMVLNVLRSLKRHASSNIHPDTKTIFYEEKTP